MTNYHDLEEYIATLPSQGGVEIGAWLDNAAQCVRQGAAIVELGCWLGGGTASLALGAMISGAPIHTFDRWTATVQEVQKAARFGVTLKEGMDTLPLVQQLLGVIPANITYHRCNIKQVEWKGGPVGLFVDDMTKVPELWKHAMDVFKPHFIPGETILVLMDYNFDISMREAGRSNWRRYSAQRDYIEANAQQFELLEDRLAGTTAASFRYRKP